METGKLLYEVVQTPGESESLPFGLRRSGGGCESKELLDLTDNEEAASLLAQLYACKQLLPDYFEPLTTALVGVLL